MTAPTRFEERLLEQLRDVVAAQPAPAPATPHEPRRGRTAVAGLAVAIAAVVAVVAVTTGSDATPSAFAVEARPDGRVTVEIQRLSDADGLERSLRAAGVPAVVDFVDAEQARCDPPRPGAAGPMPHGADGTARPPSAGDQQGDQQYVPMPERAKTPPLSFDGDRITFTIDPRNVEPGQQVHIIIKTSGPVTGVMIADHVTRPLPPASC